MWAQCGYVCVEGWYPHTLNSQEMVFGEDAQKMFEYGLAGVFQDKWVKG